MLHPTKIVIGLSCFFIVASSFSASNESSVKSLPIVLPIFQAVIDPATGYFIALGEDSVAEKLQDIAPESEHDVYSKKQSVIDGGGIILTMGSDSYPKMRIIRDKDGITHTQCSTAK